MTFAAKNGNESAPPEGAPTFFCKSIIPGILILPVLQGYHSKRLSADSFLVAFFRQRTDSKGVQYAHDVRSPSQPVISCKSVIPGTLSLPSRKSIIPEPLLSRANRAASAGLRREPALKPHPWKRRVRHPPKADPSPRLGPRCPREAPQFRRLTPKIPTRETDAWGTHQDAART
jgi:hypothetical protein